MEITTLPVSPTVLVANLPYNTAVPIVLHLLRTFPSLRRVLVMVQSEVAERLAAGPGSKAYGSPSVKAGWFGRWSVAGSISRQVFWPIPNVDSLLVAMEAHPPPGDPALREVMDELVTHAFRSRRKMARGALAEYLGSEFVSGLIEKAGLAPTDRGEAWSLDDFCGSRASSAGLPVTRREFSTAWILLAVVVGGVLGIFVPFTFPGLEIITWVALALMVFSVVSALPLLSLGKAVAKPRVVVALFAVNLVVVPVVAFILFAGVVATPGLTGGLTFGVVSTGGGVVIDDRQTGGWGCGKCPRGETAVAGGPAHCGAGLCGGLEWGGARV